MKLVGQMIPPLSGKLHKGQAGMSVGSSCQQHADMYREDRGFGRIRRVSRASLAKYSGGVDSDRCSYSGAPFFSAMGAMRFGADLAHVICEPGAGAVIKT